MMYFLKTFEYVRFLTCSSKFLHSNYLLQVTLWLFQRLGSVVTSKNELKDYSFLKIVLTFHCSNELFYWSNFFVNSQPSASNFSNFFSITRTIFGTKLHYSFLWVVVSCVVKKVGKTKRKPSFVITLQVFFCFALLFFPLEFVPKVVKRFQCIVHHYYGRDHTT